jgi:uncharacterized protein YcbX
VGEVMWLCRYPVKSVLGEPLTEAVLDPGGVVGDRRYAFVDRATGLVASAKNPRKWRSLLTLSARYVAGGDDVAVTAPDGTVVRTGDPAQVADLVSRVTGRPVELVRDRPAGAALERLTPEVEASAGVLTRGTLAAGTPGDTFVDFAPVHLVTTGTLAALSREHPGGAMDVRRFRPNIVVRMLEDRPFAENAWQGRTLSIGGGNGPAVRVITPTPRCPVPALAHGGDLADDPDVLRTAARLNRVPVLDLGTRSCVGAYAAVERGGAIRVGDPVEVA